MIQSQIVEYVWMDGNKILRSKVKILHDQEAKKLEDLPVWNFDGSSTGQAEGHFSDVFLKPVRIYNDPFRKENHLLILCECYEDALLKEPNFANHRKELAELCEKHQSSEAWAGIEQEFVLYDRNTDLPYMWKGKNEPGAGPQGPYYCGVGGNTMFGRDIIEEHMYKCIEAGVRYHGNNAEVMPSQWEFQVGTSDALKTSDDLWMARFILDKLTEKYGLYANYHPKPEKGDWNGSGGHVNFSTKEMRVDGGIDFINQALKRMGESHKEDVKEYGEHNNERMTGEHETSTLDKFTSGVGNRGCSVRISKQTHHDGKGFIEDRRPASNLDPYRVLKTIMKSVLDRAEDGELIKGDSS